jgi:phosphatidylserine decarboxylase
MKIHKEGHKIALYIVFLLILLNLIHFRIAGKTLFFYFCLLLSFGILILVVNFFRSPRRFFNEVESGLVVAPADGTIVVIEEVMENEYFFDKRIQVSIFMSLFNAHVNWVPCNGKVIKYSHQNGRFMAAYLPKSSTDNERSTIVIEREDGEQILVRQIAGAMAKRIVTYTKAGQECHINQQLGFIKFGSRVDLFLPLNTEIMIKPDECVRGNITTIAKLKA